jgi:L,D-transpeptidase ErfK/SrfK
LEAARAAPEPVEDLKHKAGLPSVIGVPRIHVVKKGETLLDVARDYNLGFNEICDLYPYIDPWIPPEGMELVIPTQWVLPDGAADGIVINAAEMRLFMTGPKREIRTFPVALGVPEWPTPLGRYRIGNKVREPVWQIPPSLRSKYGNRTVPPGPDNPLGDYWLGLEGTHYGLHGTDFVWSIGRLVTRGCIRLYPEDIRALYHMVSTGAQVSVIYEPVKIGRLEGRVYAEVHSDVYGYLDDFEQYGFERLSRSGVAHQVDIEAFQEALKRRDGMPVDVTAGRLPG